MAISLLTTKRPEITNHTLLPNQGGIFHFGIHFSVSGIFANLLHDRNVRFFDGELTNQQDFDSELSNQQDDMTICQMMPLRAS